MSSVSYRNIKRVSEPEIVIRTPLRISFFGGGTDYPAWFQKHSGRVVGAAINQYCEVAVKRLPKNSEPPLRLYYSTVELCQKASEIRHDVLRSCLEKFWSRSPIEVGYQLQLMSGSGMGSSSALTVSLLHALFQLQGRAVDKSTLARIAISLDQSREKVGCQDQVLTCYGGINQVTFSKKIPFEVTPLPLSAARMGELRSHLMLVYTGNTRLASVHAEKWIDAVKPKERLFENLFEIAGEAAQILTSSGSLLPLGELFHESWLLKQKIHKSISNNTIHFIYEMARKAGALGGKLLGAGGGGFFLLFVPPQNQAAVSKSLHFFKSVDFDWDTEGTKAITRPYKFQTSWDPVQSPQVPLR